MTSHSLIKDDFHKLQKFLHNPTTGFSVIQIPFHFYYTVETCFLKSFQKITWLNCKVNSHGFWDKQDCWLFLSTESHSHTLTSRFSHLAANRGTILNKSSSPAHGAFHSLNLPTISPSFSLYNYKSFFSPSCVVNIASESMNGLPFPSDVPRMLILPKAEVGSGGVEGYQKPFALGQ